MPHSGFAKKTYKDLQAFANHLGVPLLVSPTAYPIILRPSGDGIVDFTDVIHYIDGRVGNVPAPGAGVWRTTVQQPPPPPPPKAPPWRAEYEEGEGRSSASAPSVGMFSTFPRQRLPHAQQVHGAAAGPLVMSPTLD